MKNTAWRGCACYLKGRSQAGQFEFYVPSWSSVHVADACYLVDWEDQYTTITGNSTSSTRDYTTGNKKATFYFNGVFRTNKFRNIGFSTPGTRCFINRSGDTAFATWTRGANVYVPLWPVATNATYNGYLTATVTGTLLQGSANARANSNFVLLNIDNASAGGYGRDLWVEFQSVFSRTGAGYTKTALSTTNYIKHAGAYLDLN
jgi:hypothetical protein